MLKKRISEEELKKSLHYDRETGRFTRKIRTSNRIKAGDVAGTLTPHGYIQIHVNSIIFMAHRLAWLYVYGYLPESDLDHINRDKSDNRIENLREVSRQCNTRNTGNLITNTSGVKGVCWFKPFKKWIGQIVVDGKNKNLGYYNDFNDAVCARLTAEQCLNWSSCDKSSTAYKYVKEHIQCQQEDLQVN